MTATTTIWCSDAAHLRLLAAPRALPGGRLFVCPVVATHPASFVAQIDRPEVVDEPGALLARCRSLAVEGGHALVRIYLPDRPNPLVDALATHGFEQRRERLLLAQASSVVRRADRPTLVFEATSDADWAAERELHSAAGCSWRGVAVDPTDAVAVEQIQAATGAARRFLVEHDGVVVASYTRVDDEPFVRPKGLVVSPRARRRGVAHSILSALAGEAAAEGTPLGAVVVEGSPGEELFTAAGFEFADSFIEWVRRP